MKFTVGWLKDYLDFDCSLIQLSHKLTSIGLEVENIKIPITDPDKFIVCKVIKVEKHPNADKLKVCDVSDGKDNYNIVCGAENVKNGLITVLAKEGAIIYNQTEKEFKISKSKIRGIQSNGMLCSEEELGIEEKSTGIIELNDSYKVGKSFSDYVSDEDIDKEINTLRDQRASFDVVEREAKEGDYIKCSYEGELDGKAVSEIVPDKPMYGKQTNTWEEAGQAKGLGVDAIAEGVVGMKSGEKKEIEAKFKDDFEIAPLAGKSVIYQVEVHEVREKKAPEMDEEFFKSVKVENLEELKDRVLTDLESRKQRENQNSKRSQVTQKILELPDFPLPQQAVEDESNSIFQQRAQRAIQQGTKQEEIESQKDELWKEAKTQGEARVKLTLILGKIAEKEKVEVNNEDLARAASQEAMMMRKDPTAYIKELSKDRRQLHRLRQDILHDKTLDLVANKTKENISDTKGD